jgi:hypothetical protein
MGLAEDAGREISVKKFISVIAACVGAPLLAAGIALPQASADPTNAPGPTPTEQPRETGPDGDGMTKFRNLDDDPRDLERGTGVCFEGGCGPS